MTRYLARRLLNYLVLLALASFLTYCLTSLAFSPLESLMQRSPRPPQAVIDAKAHDLGLDSSHASDRVRPVSSAGAIRTPAMSNQAGPAAGWAGWEPKRSVPGGASGGNQVTQPCA